MKIIQVYFIGKMILCKKKVRFKMSKFHKIVFLFLTFLGTFTDILMTFAFMLVPSIENYRIKIIEQYTHKEPKYVKSVI